MTQDKKPNIMGIDSNLLDASLNALETVFKGYGIIFAVFGDGVGAVVTNRSKDETDEVMRGFLKNAEKVTEQTGEEKERPE